MAKRVLVVDDAMIMRMRIKEIARESGWEIAGEAANGEEGLARYWELRPDLMTLDIVMPKMDGLSVLRAIKQDDPHASIVMVSAIDQKGQLAECIRLGAIDFIVKPFDKARLKSFFNKYVHHESPSSSDVASATLSLYERLGGAAAIDAVVATLYKKVLADERLRRLVDGPDMPAEIDEQKKFLALAFSGLVKYDSKMLHEAHGRLNLNEQQFDVFTGHLIAALKEMKAPAELVGEAIEIVAAARNEQQKQEEI